MPAPDLSKPRPKAKSSTAKARKDASGLGRAIINRRAKEHKRLYEEALHTTELPSGLHSVTQENDLDEFLNTAQLAATDFSAERENIRVLPSTSVVRQQNPYLLTDAEEKDLRQKHRSNQRRLRVPRRPAWHRDMHKEDLERRERDDFLEWRKGLADMEDRESFLLTPFERNLSVWRQLWRTIERSHLIVQIVDARNPLGFRCEDLETYVREVGTEEDSELQAGAGKRRNLLLVNKADLLTESQRKLWADYFDTLGISYAFFSAKESVERLEEEALLEEGQDEDLEEGSDEEGPAGSEEKEAGSSHRVRTDKVDETLAKELAEDVKISQGDEEEHARNAEGHQDSQHDDDDDEQDMPFDRTQVLTVVELEELLLRLAPDLDDFALPDQPPPKYCVGLVGYPNVGKSSTINALVGQKKVSVSSTPGKTKNFQTIHLSPDIVLCDCPGLVFPQFATTKAAMVCDGVLPIDQMREHTAPVDLVTHRIPKAVLEGIYGIRIPTLPISEGGTGVPTASEFLSTYAVARGFFTQGQGNPDESRASRYILKDYVNAKLLYCHPPPGIDADAFNAEARDMIKLALSHKLRTKRAPTTRVGKKSDTFIYLPEEDVDEDEEECGEQEDLKGGAATESVVDGADAFTRASKVAPSVATVSQGSSKPKQSARANALDRNFFQSNGVSSRAFVNGVGGATISAAGRTTLYPSQRFLNDDGSKLSSRRLRELEELGAIQAASGKKHYKGGKRQKARSGAGYEI